MKIKIDLTHTIEIKKIVVCEMLEYSFFLIFFVVIFLYLHITAHYRKGEDLELFETDFINAPKLQESCEARQPLMVLGVPGIGKLPSRGELLKGNEKYEGNIRDMTAWNSEPGRPMAMETLLEKTRPRNFEMEKILRALESDTGGGYISEGNEGFLEEVGLWKLLRKWGDDRFCPSYQVMKQYDFLMGSKGACTPLRYHTAYRKFLVVRGGGGFEGDGNLVVRMTPWKSRKRLEWIRDDIGMETVSSMAAFGGRKDQLEDWSKVRFLEFIVPEGQVLSIPPYWWYSIRFPGPRVFAYSFTYWTAMNWLANADIWARYVWICHSGTGGDESRKIISITPPLEESESVMQKVVECKVCDVSEAAAAAEALELEIKEEYAQKEDPVFQSLVIPT
jgi:hypothetical protein